MAGFLSEPNTVDCPALVRRALSPLGLGSEEDGYKFLASNETDRKATLIDLVNQSVQDVLDENPKLNIAAAASLTATADTRTTAAPADLRVAEILSMRWDDDERKPVNFIGRDEVLDLPESYREDDFSEEYPTYASLDWQAATISWWGLPATTRTLTIVYRAQETLFVVADLASTATKLVVPNFGAQAVVDRLSWYLAGHKDGWDSKLAKGCLFKYEMSSAALDRKIRQEMAEITDARFGYEGMPAGNTDPFEELRIWE